MIDSIKNIYKSEDLYGEFLVQPIKIYHHFFEIKIEESSDLKKCAWLVANAVTGIFAYVGFGALTGLGILVKLTGISSLRKHNESEKARIDVIHSAVKYTTGYMTDSSSSMLQAGQQMCVIKEFTVTRQNIDEIYNTINQEIDTFSNQFKKVYIASRGSINSNQGEITVQLRTRG